VVAWLRSRLVSQLVSSHNCRPDVQWLGEPSVAVLRYALGRLERERVAEPGGPWRCAVLASSRPASNRECAAPPMRRRGPMPTCTRVQAYKDPLVTLPSALGGKEAWCST
jgi:hypothetical protein